MKKIRIRSTGFVSMVFFLIVTLPFLSGALWGSVEVSFRLSGSLGYLQDGAGDIDKARQGMEAAINTLYQDDRYSTTFSWERPSKTNDFRAEIVFKLSRNFGISIGSGYILAKNSGNYSFAFDFANEYEEDYYEKIDQNANYFQSYNVSSIPVTLDAYLFLPIGKRETFKIFAHAGAGYYFGRLKHTIDFDGTFIYERFVSGNLDVQEDISTKALLTEKANSNSWGFHGGLGLDVKLTRLLSIGAEVSGRHVNFRDWEGSQVIKTEYKEAYWFEWYGEGTSEDTDTDSAYGKTWTYETDLGMGNGNQSYAVMGISDEKPESKYFKNVRLSAINLNSYGFTVSVKLSFDLF
jgi:hypothetical protein